MKLKRFNEAYDEHKIPSGKQMKLLFDTFNKYGEMVINDKDIKELMKDFPDMEGIENMKIGNYLVSIKIKKRE
jgi:hypothetical protein